MAAKNNINPTEVTKREPWSVRRTMSIIVQDDTYKDVDNLSLVVKNNSSSTDSKDSCHSESRTFTLMVEPDDTIAAIKSYIQEEKGIPFKKQKLLNEEGKILRDAHALPSVGIMKDSTLILRYATVMQIIVRNLFLSRCDDHNFMVWHDDTIGDVKAMIQEKKGFRFHSQKLTFCGNELCDFEHLDDLGIQNGSVLVLRCNSVMQIFVIYGFSGHVLKLRVDPDDTIGDVKCIIYGKEGIRFHKQSLIFNGKECADSDLLVNLGIQDDTELILQLRECSC